jgi:hypothetical protein
MTARSRLPGVLALPLSAALFCATAGHAAAPAAPTAPLPAPGLKATLIGSNEVPGPGDPDGTGTATVTFDPVRNQVCYTLTVDKVEGVTMAHIHRAPMGSMGDVVAPLQPPTSGSSEGCARIAPDLAAAIQANPSEYYVNVHSETHIAGAVRGQLGK